MRTPLHDIPGIEDSGAPEISVASDGTIYIVWLGNNDIDVQFVKSVDGGDSFATQMVVAKGIVPLSYPYIENTHGDLIINWHNSTISTALSNHCLLQF